MGDRARVLGWSLSTLAVLSCATARPSDAVALGTASLHGRLCVTLLSTSALSAQELKGAPGGRRLVWLIEGAGERAPPAFGEVRFAVNGRPYNRITSPATSGPLAPDLIVHDYQRFAVQHPDWLGSAQPLAPSSALVAEVLIRGGEPLGDEPGVAGIELGWWPSPGQKPRWVWFEATTTP